jgi:TolB-like protein
MTDPLARLRRFLRELKRRNVYQVTATYLVAAFVVLQLASLAADAFGLPGWFEPMVWVLCGLGLPIALVLAWAFERTPEGVRRTAEPEGEPAGSAAGGAGGWLAALVVLLLAGGGAWLLTAGGGEAPRTASTARTDTTARRASASSDTAAPPRIAVLPFENIARDSADAFFAEGVHEEVLNQLSKVSGLEVISRTSVMGYANTDKRVPEISRELGGVDALLEGTVRRAGERVRITTQLIESPADEHLWSNTYERTLSPEAIFEIQADIAGRIAGALETELTAGERRRIEDAPTSSLDAYDAYLRGRRAVMRSWGSLDPTDVDEAVDHLRGALRRDSTFAEAHALLGQAYVGRSATSGDDRWLDSARTAAERALALDPGLTEALETRAQVNRRSDSLEAAEALYRRILDREPSNVLALEGMNDIAQSRNQPVERVRWAHRAVRLEPRGAFYATTMASALADAGLWDPAAAWARRAIDLAPDQFAGHALLAVIQGRTSPETALETLRPFLEGDRPHPFALRIAGSLSLEAGAPGRAKSFLERIPEAQREFYPEDSPSRPEHVGLSPMDRVALGIAERGLGARERGQRLLRQAADSLQEAADRAETGPGATVNLAAARAALDQRDRALELLQRVLGDSEDSPPAPTIQWHMSGYVFDDLRSDPRFQEILREVEARRDEIRREVRALGIDLYPPGAGPGTPG